MITGKISQNGTKSFRRECDADRTTATADLLVHTGCANASLKVSAEAAACREMKALLLLFPHACHQTHMGEDQIQFLHFCKRKILKKVWWVLQFPWGMNFILWEWLKHTRQVSFIPRVGFFFLNVSLFLHLAPPLSNNSLLLINLRTSNSRRDVVHSRFSLELHLCPVQSGAEGVVASFIQSSTALFFTN